MPRFSAASSNTRTITGEMPRTVPWRYLLVALIAWWAFWIVWTIVRQRRHAAPSSTTPA